MAVSVQDSSTDPVTGAGPLTTSPLAEQLRLAFDLPEAQSIALSNAVFDEAARGASEAATEVVTRGIVSFGAVSVASLLAPKIFASTLLQMGFVAGVGFAATKFVRGDFTE